jgi:hypothetical protein
MWASGCREAHTGALGVGAAVSAALGDTCISSREVSTGRLRQGPSARVRHGVGATGSAGPGALTHLALLLLSRRRKLGLFLFRKTQAVGPGACERAGQHARQDSEHGGCANVAGQEGCEGCVGAAGRCGRTGR